MDFSSKTGHNEDWLSNTVPGCFVETWKIIYLALTEQHQLASSDYTRQPTHLQGALWMRSP